MRDHIQLTTDTMRKTLFCFKNDEAREDTLPEVSWLLSAKPGKELDHVGDDGELSDLGTNIPLFCLLVLMVLRIES